MVILGEDIQLMPIYQHFTVSGILLGLDRVYSLYVFSLVCDRHYLLKLY